MDKHPSALHQYHVVANTANSSKNNLNKTNKMAKQTKKKATSKKADPRATFDQIKGHVEEMEQHFEKFDNGVKASVGKIRKSAMEIKKLTAVLRKEVQEAKASM